MAGKKAAGRHPHVQSLHNLLQNYPNPERQIGKLSPAAQRQIAETLGRAGKGWAGSEEKFLSHLRRELAGRGIGKKTIEDHVIEEFLHSHAPESEKAEFSRAFESLKGKPIPEKDPVVQAAFSFQHGTLKPGLQGWMQFLEQAQKTDSKKALEPFLRAGIKPEEVGLRPGTVNRYLMPDYDAGHTLQLLVRGKRVGLISFDFHPQRKTLQIEQIAGVSGFSAFGKGVLEEGARELQKNVRWEKALIKSAERMAALLGFEKVTIASGKTVWSRGPGPGMKPEAIKMHYDATPKRMGYRLEAGYWCKFVR